MYSANWWWYHSVAWNYKQKPSKLQSEVSPMEWTHLLGPLPNWNSRLLLTWKFPALFKSRCRLLSQFGNVHTITSLYCFYFFSFNAHILKLTQKSIKKLKMFLYNKWFLLLTNTLNLKWKLNFRQNNSLLKIFSISHHVNSWWKQISQKSPCLASKPEKLKTK